MNNNGDYLDALKYIIDYDFLILDDVGSVGMNEWRKEIIFSLVDLRYESKKPTVVTSNWKIEGLEELFGSRVFSRMFATRNLIIDGSNWQDQRQRGL